MHYVSLLQILSEKAQNITQTSALSKLAKGKASLEDWQHWGHQKYLSSSSFLILLKKFENNAKNESLNNIAKAIRENICDEKGISKTSGEQLKAGSHEAWRICFYQALGIDKEKLINTEPLTSTLKYHREIQILADSVCVWSQVGALLALEYMIAIEMEALDLGLDATPCLQKIFDRKIKSGRVNRMYITHHAAHDMKQHFPDLLKAVLSDFNTLPAEQQDHNMNIIHNSIQKIATIKTNFYEGLNI